MKEVEIGKNIYLHKEDEEYDHLIDTSDNEIKVHLTFTKDRKKNEAAKLALMKFFCNKDNLH